MSISRERAVDLKLKQKTIQAFKKFLKFLILFLKQHSFKIHCDVKQIICQQLKLPPLVNFFIANADKNIKNIKALEGLKCFNIFVCPTFCLLKRVRTNKKKAIQKFKFLFNELLMPIKCNQLARPIAAIDKKAHSAIGCKFIVTCGNLTNWEIKLSLLRQKSGMFTCTRRTCKLYVNFNSNLALYSLLQVKLQINLPQINGNYECRITA